MNQLLVMARRQSTDRRMCQARRGFQPCIDGPGKPRTTHARRRGQPCSTQGEKLGKMRTEISSVPPGVPGRVLRLDRQMLAEPAAPWLCLPVAGEVAERLKATVC